ncbi:hypothetical protein LXL04_001483 [Taraxacum kok-saghyz]
MELIRWINSIANFLLVISCFTHLSMTLGVVPYNQGQSSYFLVPHNKARAQVGLQLLTWNMTLEAYAHGYAYHRVGDCDLRHSEGPFGENLAEGYGDEFTATDAVNLWIGEKQYYEYESNSCVGDECRHYTQVVWRDSIHIGCAKLKCHNVIVLFIMPSLANLSLALDIDFLIPHNEARAEVGVQPLQWNKTLVDYATGYAYQRMGDCSLQHSEGPFGENLAIGYGDQLTEADVVAMWVGEKQYYDYESNSCFGDECLHYTQVVWRDTVHVGCAKVECYNDGWFAICNYNPPGNYEDQRPY